MATLPRPNIKWCKTHNVSWHFVSQRRNIECLSCSRTECYQLHWHSRFATKRLEIVTIKFLIWQVARLIDIDIHFKSPICVHKYTLSAEFLISLRACNFKVCNNDIYFICGLCKGSIQRLVRRRVSHYVQVYVVQIRDPKLGCHSNCQYSSTISKHETDVKFSWPINSIYINNECRTARAE